MVETSLTPELVQAGAQLVRALDDAGMSPDAAFWFYLPDVKAWKLVLAEVKLGSHGPREVYRQIQRALGTIYPGAPAIDLDDVVLAKPDAPIVTVLKRAIATGPGTTGVRFSQNVIDGVLIEDAYIYRLSKPAV